MFRCTDFKIMDALGEALSRGVAVELLLTQRAKGWEKKIRELGQYLESMGAHVQRYREPSIKYHAKYMVVDGSRALVTSMNLMKRHFEKTSDYVLGHRRPRAWLQAWTVCSVTISRAPATAWWRGYVQG